MNEAKKEFLVFAGWIVLLVILLSFYACGGGWEVCGYDFDKI